MSACKRVAVLVSGNGTNLQALIDAAKSEKFPAEIKLVISNRAEAFGLVRAKNAGIDTLVIEHSSFSTREDFDAALHAALIDKQIELVCLAGFMRLLTPDFTRKWEGRMINIHPSLLPVFKGLHTHKRALEAGVKFAGCTVHFVSAEMDEGPMIIQAVVPVLPDDSEDTLAARVLTAEHQIYPRALGWLAEGNLTLENGKAKMKSAAPPSEAALVNPQ